MVDKKTKIELWNVLRGNYGAIIVPAKTGIFYTNQVGGVFCLHPEIEGFAIPIYLTCGKELYDYFERGFFESLNKKDADYVDELFSGYLSLYGIDIKVDRKRLKIGTEAWIPVNIKIHNGYTNEDTKFKDCFLTWENSD